MDHNLAAVVFDQTFQLNLPITLALKPIFGSGMSSRKSLNTYVQSGFFCKEIGAKFAAVIDADDAYVTLTKQLNATILLVRHISILLPDREKLGGLYQNVDAVNV